MAGIIRCFNSNCRYWDMADDIDHCTKPLTLITKCPDAKLSDRQSLVPDNYYLQVLMGNACRCGAAKQRGRALCRDCYKALPDDMQFALYRKIGHGFEEAYEAAVKYLED